MTVALSTYRVAYTPIPKVACSSIKRAFYELKYGEAYDPHHLRVRLAGGRVHGVFPSTKFDPAEFARLGDYWKFSVVRDPASRIISTWSDKVMGRDGLAQSELPRGRDLRSVALRLRGRLRRLGRRGRVAGELSLRPSLNDFVLRLDAYQAGFHVIEEHTRPAGYYLGPDLSVYDAIFRIDQLDALADALSARLGRRFDLPRVNVSHKRRKLTVDDLSDDAFDALMERLAPEYELLAAYFPRPGRPGQELKRTGA
jgi:Sulfotransferase family